MTGRRTVSAVVTTLNNADTLQACLDSLAFADELLVLDSGSQDGTLEIARSRGARVKTQPFRGYGPQKQDAIDLAQHDWVLLLDADEVLAPGAAQEIEQALIDPRCSGFRLPRRERMFWRWQHRWSRHNHYLRLFDRRVHRMNDAPIHAAPDPRGGRVGTLAALILHHGERSIESKVARINHYSSGLAAARANRPRAFLLPLRLLIYPPFVFLRQWLWKRQFLNGWPGFIVAVSQAYYAFLKDAKALEWRRQNRRR